MGGCIGLNASEEILETELAISPTSIKGNYHVGGCIGANVVNLTKNRAMTKVKADNRLGSITGNAFTGGVIGYQRTYTEEQLKEELNNANPGWLGQAGGSGFGGNGLSSHDIFGKNGKILLLSYIEGIDECVEICRKQANRYENPCKWCGNAIYRGFWIYMSLLDGLIVWIHFHN